MAKISALTSLVSPDGSEHVAVAQGVLGNKKVLLSDCPVSTPQATAIAGRQLLNSHLTAISGLTPTNNDFMQFKSGAWANRTIAQIKTDLAYTQDEVGDGSTYKQYSATEKTKVGYITVTQAVDLDAIEARVNELDASVILKGDWDASSGVFPGAGVAQAGWSYFVTVGGTVDGVQFSVNDRVIAKTDNASTGTFAGNWIKADYTDQVLTVNGQTGTVSLNTSHISDTTDKRYVTDAQLTVIGNTSGSNSGDQTSIVGITGTKAQFDTACTDGSFLFVGDITQYTDELAQDAIGFIVDTTLIYDDGTPSLVRAALTGDVTAPQGSNTTTIAAAAVTLAKMANLAQDQFIGRTTASTGVPETATITAAARSVLDDATVADMVNTLGGATSTGTGGLARENSPSFITPALGTPSALVGTNISGTAASLTAGTVTTNANLTGDITSTGNATTAASALITGKTTVTADGADYILLADASDSNNLKKALISDIMGGSGLSVEMLHITDEKSSGTAGGSTSATTWHTRALNTVVTNTITGASLSSNQITLDAGTYRIFAQAEMHESGANRLRLRNITDSTTVASGVNSHSGSSGASLPNPSAIMGARFTIASTKTFELQHYASLAKATIGLGVAASTGEVEVYAEITIFKE